jgi:hypothetical protein
MTIEIRCEIGWETILSESFWIKKTNMSQKSHILDNQIKTIVFSNNNINKENYLWYRWFWKKSLKPGGTVTYKHQIPISDYRRRPTNIYSGILSLGWSAVLKHPFLKGGTKAQIQTSWMWKNTLMVDRHVQADSVLFIFLILGYANLGQASHIFDPDPD